MDRFKEKAHEILEKKDHYETIGDETIWTPNYQKLFVDIANALYDATMGKPLLEEKSQ